MGRHGSTYQDFIKLHDFNFPTVAFPACKVYHGYRYACSIDIPWFNTNRSTSERENVWFS